MGKKNSLSNGGFTVDFLAGDRAAVSQGDNTEVVSTEQYNALKVRSAYEKATAEYDQAVKDFHKPLTDAADKLAQANFAPADDTFIEVLHPEVEGILHAEAEIIHLSKDTVILRFIEQDTTDRLIWVNGSLEVRAK